MKNIDQYRGCLIGGAVGDALGYAVEFMSIQEIRRQYGTPGITTYELERGKAQISDDTQMTLYTANGLLWADTARKQEKLVSFPSGIWRCYLDWLQTQYSTNKPGAVSWLNNLPDMNHPRAPGGACLRSLRGGIPGSVTNPINNSKGCGGVMRVAPVALYAGDDFSTEILDMLGAEAAALTHGHPLGYIPAAMLVHLVYLLTHRSGMTLRQAVEESVQAMSELFGDVQELNELLDLIDLAVRLAEDPAVTDHAAVSALGEGWVAEETLAIAVYCVLRYPDNFEQAMIVAVNHSGDSDSTGAVAGNILGAHLGLSAIPEKFLRDLELKDTILEIADDLYHGCPDTIDDVWAAKYIHHTWPKA
ncbi:MAG: ADP-ribosylglycohydrolase family protein [Clostridia bacterium]|nr:ADP-ribosylglycohydrolase family protein [Clostridia bacterium]